MLNNPSRICFGVIASILTISLCVTTQAQKDHMSDNQFTEQLTKTMERVRTGESVNVRTESAQDLAKLTRGIDPKKVGDKTLTDLVSLLDTSEDSVRLWVAASLGNLGPRAKTAAAPTLLKLLPEVDCVRASVTSAPAIRVALKRMGVTPPPPGCETRK